jgi:hypothetical protein
MYPRFTPLTFHVLFLYLKTETGFNPGLGNRLIFRTGPTKKQVELFEKGPAPLNRFEKIWIFFINRFKFSLNIILSFVKTENKTDSDSNSKDRVQVAESRVATDSSGWKLTGLFRFKVSLQFSSHWSGILRQNRFNRYNTG